MTFIMRFLGIEVDASPTGFVDIKGALTAAYTVRDAPGQFRETTTEFTTLHGGIAFGHGGPFSDQRPIRLAVGDLLKTPVVIGQIAPRNIVFGQDLLGAPRSITVAASELPTTESPKIITLRFGDNGQSAHATFQLTKEETA
ncbi:hypothetical protein [Nocardia sp. CA-119907]|uniref:hypothetical protein n=1 Tax=Nocardia sp. CA-119907 TaxID=3239973 RepID=UPI003D9858AE